MILSNLNRSLGFAPNDPGTSLSQFYDAYQLASWALDATKQMVLLGVVTGGGERLYGQWKTLACTGGYHYP